jgi:hypothetical protein
MENVLPTPLLTGKSVSRSVSLPERLWPVVDSHAEGLGGDRSSWIAGLVIPALRAAGKLDDAPACGKAEARFKELQRALPEEKLLVIMDAVAQEAAAQEAGV